MGQKDDAVLKEAAKADAKRAREQTLKQEIEELKRTVELLQATFRQAPKKIPRREQYRYIQTWRTVYAVKHMCQALGASESGYYRWLRRPAK